MEKLIQILGIITPPLLYWLIETIKSKNLSNRISDLKNEIEFTKGINSELSSTLIDIYCAKIFHQQFGFEVLPSRVNAYLRLFRKCDVSVKTYRYLHQKFYLKFNKSSGDMKLVITKIDTWMFALICFGALLLLLISMFIIYFLSDSVNLRIKKEELIFVQTGLIISYIFCCYFAIKLLIKDIIPYFQAISITKNLKDEVTHENIDDLKNNPI
ncbi:MULTISPECIES: hypothetical protein [Sphingobacterium]|uniref:hypothetical protein n=1 Tax=Sphingobacterium TaxID=28453 RepID=UPI00257D7B51|nr:MULTISPECIES: hypothetical protein [Sphingobacterium]